MRPEPLTHHSMLRVIDAIDAAIRRIGVVAGYLVLAIAAVQVCGSVLRYFFSFGSILLQELILSLNVVVVALAICFGVLRNVHTRVDILNGGRSSAPAFIEAVAVAFLLLPTAAFLVAALVPYVAQSWTSFEGSRNVGGLGGIYLVKTVLLAMAALLVVQTLTILVRLALRTEPYPDGAQGPVEG
jgi:TRAP-type mannitol/chloroaromatic compound transport system permease small subunit